MADNNKNIFQRIASRFTGSNAEVPTPQKSASTVRYGLPSASLTYNQFDYKTDASLALETVFACTARISQAVAALEINAYKVGANGRDKVAHPLKDLFTRKPHDRYSAFNWWENIISDSLLFGKGYAVILKDGNTVTGLEYIPASAVAENTYKGEDIYTVSYTERTGTKRQVRYTADQLFIVSGFRGLNVFQLHRETLDLAKYSREFGVDYFRHGGSMGGVLEVPHELTDEQYEAMRAGWTSNYSGMGKHHGTPILEMGVTYKQLSIPPEEAQFIETRKYTDQAIARIFQVPAALIGLDTNVTFSNVEQQNIFFATYTIAPLVKRIENEIATKLVIPAQRNRIAIEFDMSSLLRADASTRATYYQTLLNTGVMTINEVRSIEGLNPVEGGDTALVQMNQIPLNSMPDYADSVTTGNEAENLPEEEEEA